jgi:hypothetical protein
MTIFGWDLSHFDAPSIGDAIGEGFSFFTHKGGGDANDAEIAQWWNGVKGTDPKKALLGAYWVLYPGHGASAGDAFADRLDATCPGWGNREFILQLDCEKWNGDSSTVPSKADIIACCKQLQVRAPKLRPIVYAPEWVYGDNLSGLGYPLWASRYATATSGTASGIYASIGGDNSSKWSAYSGQVPAILQFTSSATIAGQTTCDANAFRGTLDDLKALVAPGWKVVDVELTDKIGDDTYPNRTVGDVFRDVAKLRGFLVGDTGDTTAAAIKASAPVQGLVGLSGETDQIIAKLNSLNTSLTTLSTTVAGINTPQIDLNALAQQLAPLLNNHSQQEIQDALMQVRFSFPAAS